MVAVRDARSGELLNGLDVTLGADMPSMPMAHNAWPARAAPAAEPGAYEARLELDMPGEWAVRVDIAEPVRDRVVQVLRFGDEGAPAPATGAAVPSHRH